MSTARGTKQSDIKEPKGFVCFFGEKEPVTWERETYRYVYKVRRLKKENNKWLANNKIFDEKMDKEEIFLLKNNTYEVLSYSDESSQTGIQKEDTYLADNLNETNKNLHNPMDGCANNIKSDIDYNLYIIDKPSEETKQPFQLLFTYDISQEEKNLESSKKKKTNRKFKRTKKDYVQPLQLEFVF